MADLLFSEGPIRALQRFSSPLVDAAFVAITTTGGVVFLLVLVVLLYWLVDKRLAFFLGVVLLSGWAVNGFLKALFGMPRPPASLHIPSEVGGNGFPSGHTQAATTLWGSLAAKVRGIWVAVGAAVIFGVGLSRVYLGVHYVGDVLGGLAFGLALVGGFLAADRADVWARTDLPTRVLLAVLLPGGLAGGLWAAGYAIPAIWGLLTGIAVGYVLEGAWVGLERPVGAGAAGLRILLGVPPALGLFLLVSATSDLALFLLGHLAVGLLVALGLPALFRAVESRLP